jgi:hypothetical protein
VEVTLGIGMLRTISICADLHDLCGCVGSCAEQEQEQKKTVEQEEQSQVRFSREDEQQRSWKIHELARFLQQTPHVNPAPSRSSSSVVSALGLAASATVNVREPDGAL